MRLVFVPDWVIPALKVSGKDYTALGGSAWATTLSTQDVSFYDYVLDRLADTLPNSVVNTFTGSWSIGLDRINMPDYDWEQHYRVKADHCLQYGESADVLAVLKACALPDAIVTLQPGEREIGFDVLSEVDDTFYVRPKAVSNQGMLQCYDQVFAVLYKKYGMEKIVSLPLFSDYESRKAGAAL